jgi:hypothetical protein
MDELHHKIQVNPHADAYKGFFEEDWRQHFQDLIRESKISEAGFTLTKHWWAISNARQMPLIFVDSVDQVMCNKIDSLEPNVCKIVKYLSDNIISLLEADNVKVRPMLHKSIKKAIKTVSENIYQIKEHVSEEVISRRDNLWDGLIDLPPFHTSLWSLERLCYAGLYYIYEWFLTECVRTKLNKPEYCWYGTKQFTSKFRELFGDVLTNECWLDNKVDLARETRHALVHNGGKLTKNMRERNHPFAIENGEIQINAEHTTELYKELKSRVNQLVEAAIRMPEFKLNEN